MVDALGLGLFILGLALVVIELGVPGYFIGVIGSLGLVMGLAEMIRPGFLTSPGTAWLASLVAAAATLVAYLFYARFAPPVRDPARVTDPPIVGDRGRVHRAIVPPRAGQVEIGGRRWLAQSRTPLPRGAPVEVVKVEATVVSVEARPATLASTGHEYKGDRPEHG